MQRGLVKHAAGRIEQIGQRHRHRAVAGKNASPVVGQRLRGLCMGQARNQAFELGHGLLRVAKQLHAVLHAQHVKTCPGCGQTVAGGLDAVDANVGMDKAPPQIVCHLGRNSAAAEEICHHHAGVGGSLDDAFEQGFGLLRGVIYAFGGLGVDCGNVVPQRLAGHAFEFILIHLEPNALVAGEVQAAFAVMLLHGLQRAAPQRGAALVGVAVAAATQALGSEVAALPLAPIRVRAGEAGKILV